MSTPSNHSGTISGTVGGTLLVTLMNIDTGDLVKTAVLSFVGAVVSFLVSLALKWAAKKFGT